jgi:hypothetical protein
VDELNRYPLGIGKRWGFWTDKTLPGEGAVVTSLRPDSARERLARITSLRLGRYRRPFDASREADWIAAAVDLAGVSAVFTGAKGWPVLENNYAATVAALSARVGRDLAHHTYKQDCGEFGAASAFGFAATVEWVRQNKRGAILFTLSPRGGKAVCGLAP